MALWNWSRTSANANGSADPGINFLENQAPSSLNDSCRALMQATAQYRDDVAGGTVTTGASQAYQLSTFSNFTSASALANQMVCFTPHVTNGAVVTMTIDSVPNVPLRSSPGKELPAGVLIQGSVYSCTYNATDGALYLQGFYGNTYGIPIAGGMTYYAPTPPSSIFAFPYGQAISRTTYATLWGLIGVTYGPGDGSATFNLPDERGRVQAGADNMGGSAAGRLTSASGMGTGLLGQVGGGETETLTLAQAPTGITSSQSGLAVNVSSSVRYATGSAIVAQAFGTGGQDADALQPGSGVLQDVSSTGAINVNVASNNTGGQAHPNVQPTICVNKLIRII
jgi:microcystin-dependent protein